MASSSTKLPQLNVCKSREVYLETINPQNQRIRVPVYEKYLHPKQDLPKTIQRSQALSPGLKRPGISKIASIRHENSSSLDFQAVKFESIKWSENSVVHPGFFNLPSINRKGNFSLEKYSKTPEKEKNFSVNRRNPLDIEAIEENSPVRKVAVIPKKYLQLKTPWTFQTASFIVPHEG